MSSRVGGAAGQAAAERHGGTLDEEHGTSHSSYKNHVNVDKQHKLIRRYAVTDAAVHDSQMLEDVLLSKEVGIGYVLGTRKEQSHSHDHESRIREAEQKLAESQQNWKEFCGVSLLGSRSTSDS